MMSSRFSLQLMRTLLPILLLFFSTLVGAADKCPTGIKAVTDKNAKVNKMVLNHRLKPLTKCELMVEADAWLNILKEKVTEISSAEVAAVLKREEIKTTKQVEKALQQVEEAKQEVRDAEEMSKQAEASAKKDTTQDAKGESEKIKEESSKAKEETQKAKAEAVEEEKEAAKKVNEAMEASKAIEKEAQQDATIQKAIKQAEDKAKETGIVISAKDSSTDAKEELKTAILLHISELTAQRTAVIDRFNLVLLELTAKGGETKEYDDYIKSVSGIKVDITDASATWTTITSWLSSTEGGVRWAVNFIQFIVIFFVFYLLSFGISRMVKTAISQTKHTSALLQDFFVVSSRRLVLFIGFFVGMSALEVNVGPVLAIIGAAGFVIALALQNSLSNFASGILMLIYRPFDIGEVIQVAGVLGKVETMNLLSTQLRTPDNQLLVVPNNSVWGGVITNVTGISQRRVDMVFGIGYSDDIDKAQRVLEEIVEAHELILKEPAPVIKLNELGESSVNFICRPWVKPENYWNVYWDITKTVKQRFDAENINIPFPQRDVHLYQQNP